jgi:hypothetical protein
MFVVEVIILVFPLQQRPVSVNALHHQLRGRRLLVASLDGGETISFQFGQSLFR